MFSRCLIHQRISFNSLSRSICIDGSVRYGDGRETIRARIDNDNYIYTLLLVLRTEDAAIASNCVFWILGGGAFRDDDEFSFTRESPSLFYFFTCCSFFLFRGFCSDARGLHPSLFLGLSRCMAWGGLNEC